MTMHVKPINITIRELTEKYCDLRDNGVTAYNGKLNVRPAFQREFVYTPDKRDAVWKSIYNNLPLNVMYWAKNPDGTFEIIDGQQRTISICQYVTDDDGYGNQIAINFDGRRTQKFDGLSPEKQKEILDDYKLQIYICDGNDDEKLDWFNTINIAGEPMTTQELLNANYTGTWLTNAKAYFSKKENNPALNYAFYDNDDKKTLLNHSSESANRQDLLNMVLHWITDTNSTNDIEPLKEYMAKHRFDDNANELIQYFQNVIDWVKKNFITYYKDMRGLPWGFWYNKYHDKQLNPTEIDNKIKEYMADIEVQSKKGTYEYILTNDKKHLNLRQFDEATKRSVYAEQGGRCKLCEHTPNEDKVWKYEEMEGDHIIPWSRGGKTVPENCQMLCKLHNRIKSDI